MGLFDFFGPTSRIRSTRDTRSGQATRRGWDALPALPSAAEQKAAPQRSFPTYDPMLGAIFYSSSGPRSGAPASNSAVAACLQAIASAVAEPELRVYRMDGKDRIELEETELGKLLARPNPYMSLDTLLAYAATSLHVDGNAYWRKLRAGHPERGNVVELWPICPSRIEPWTRPGSDDYITGYRYTNDAGRPDDLAPSNVVHFRYGLDDADHRLGYGPLKKLLAEISSDEQATRYADRLLANFAINGLSVEWEKDTLPLSEAQAKEIKARVAAAYGGDNVGAVSVLSPGAKLVTHGFSPEQMDLKVLHRVPEERISAVTGVPAIVAGLGAGLDRSTYANVREAREMFTEQKLLPLWASLAATITLSLVPDFESDPAVLVAFDTADVRALGEDQNALAERLKTLVEAGILTLDEARAELGYGPRPDPASVLSLPAAASRRGARARAFPARKALPDDFAEIRDDQLSDWDAELVAFLTRQLGRVNSRLRAGGDTAAELVPDGEAILLGETLVPLQTALVAEIERVVAADLGIAFELDDPATREYLRAAGANIRGITDTTRDAVSAALTEGQAAGEGIEQLARRLRALPAFGSTRAQTIARTELGTSQNLAALASYRASGVVVGVRVLDGDYDAACEAMNGRTFTLDQAPPPLQHPRCVRAFAPITDVDELARSA